MISNENLCTFFHMSFHSFKEFNVLIKFHIKYVILHSFCYKKALHVFLNFDTGQIFTMICYSIAESSLSMNFPLDLEFRCSSVSSNLLLETKISKAMISISSLKNCCCFLHSALYFPFFYHLMQNFQIGINYSIIIDILNFRIVFHEIHQYCSSCNCIFTHFIVFVIVVLNFDELNLFLKQVPLSCKHSSISDGG